MAIRVSGVDRLLQSWLLWRGSVEVASLKYPSLVLDASAVVWIMEGSPEAAAFQQAVLEAELVLAPELMLTEVSNGLWRLQRTGQLQADGLQRSNSPVV